MTRLLSILILSLGLAHLEPAAAAAQLLYDGTGGSLPTAQSWLYLTDPLLGADATQSASSAGVILDTTATAGDSAGYFSTFHPQVPVLERSAGYRLEFTARVESEEHASNDRAGFSVIALSDDLLGIELGFWDDEIWAQSGADFQHAEGAAHDTTAGLIEYQLHVAGGTYELWTGGAPLLGGALRDYSSHPHPVYSLSNFLFFGDDTGSAEARIELARVFVETGTAVPEPAAWLLAVAGGALLVLRRRRA